MIGGGRFWMMPPTALAAMPGNADAGGKAIVGRPGGSATVGAEVAPPSPLAATAASPAYTAADASVFGPVVLIRGIAADGWTGTSGVAVGAAVVGGGATAAAVALGAGGASSFLLHPNDDNRAGNMAAVTTATTSGAVFMRSESIPSPFRSARLSG
jgi:hypothetical protein